MPDRQTEGTNEKDRLDAILRQIDLDRERNAVHRQLLDHRSRSLNLWLALVAAFTTLVFGSLAMFEFVVIGRVNSNLDAAFKDARAKVDEAAEIAQEVIALRSDLEQRSRREKSVSESFEDRFAQIAESIQGFGYSEVGRFESNQNALNTGESYDFDLRLAERQEYVLAAVCDETCRDLDIALSDHEGTLLEQDRLSDAVPQIGYVPSPMYTPENLGNFKAQVSMFLCEVEAGDEKCAWQLRLYSRSSPEPLCSYERDGECDAVGFVGSTDICPMGTDKEDCEDARIQPTCLFENNGQCDAMGNPGRSTNRCPVGTDLADCRAR